MYILEPQQTEPAHGHGAGRGAVGVIIGDNQQALLLSQGCGEQRHCTLHAQQ